jgi:predicted DNA-binding transcriptional regulator YafY
MNRTDRLYAMVEELRAIAPRPRSARWLAGRFEVCARTVERDIGARGFRHWYLLAWCRLRGQLRVFRLDRIVEPVATEEPAPPRRLDPAQLTVPFELRSPALAG